MVMPVTYESIFMTSTLFCAEIITNLKFWYNLRIIDLKNCEASELRTHNVSKQWKYSSICGKINTLYKTAITAFGY